MQTKKLITLIKNITGVEPFNKSRKTPNVFARAIFYKILYDRFKTTKVDISRKVNKPCMLEILLHESFYYYIFLLLLY